MQQSVPYSSIASWSFRFDSNCFVYICTLFKYWFKCFSCTLTSFIFIVKKVIFWMRYVNWKLLYSVTCLYVISVIMFWILNVEENKIGQGVFRKDEERLKWDLNYGICCSCHWLLLQLVSQQTCKLWSQIYRIDVLL